MRRAFRKGFTLIELMVVIGIILLLVSIVVFGLRHVNAMAARKETIAEMNICANMLKEYESVNGSTNSNGTMNIMNIEGPAATVPKILIPDAKNPSLPPTVPILAPVYQDALPLGTPITGPPPSYISINDLAGTSSTGDMGDRGGYLNSRYTAPAVQRTQAIMFVLLKDPKNRAMLSQVSPKRILEGTPDPTTAVVTQFPPEYSVVLDGWGNPIIFVPKGGMLVWMNPSGTGTNYIVRSSGQYLAKPDGTFQLATPSDANDTPFFASAGQDGIFTDPASKSDNAIDNIYSFQQQ